MICKECQWNKMCFHYAAERIECEPYALECVQSHQRFSDKYDALENERKTATSGDLRRIDGMQDVFIDCMEDLAGDIMRGSDAEENDSDDLPF